jgi:hypothetical protein
MNPLVEKIAVKAVIVVIGLATVIMAFAVLASVIGDAAFLWDNASWIGLAVYLGWPVLFGLFVWLSDGGLSLSTLRRHSSPPAHMPDDTQLAPPREDRVRLLPAPEPDESFWTAVAAYEPPEYRWENEWREIR